MDFLALLKAMPGSVAQGLIWGILAIGVFITFKILNYADMTVDGSLCTGGAVAALLITKGVNPILALLGAFIAGMLAGLITGLLHTKLGIPAILSGILSQLALYSVNLHIMGKSNLPVSRKTYHLLLTSYSVNPAILVSLILIVLVIGLLYWFFGTEVGCAIRATGGNEHMARAQGINTNRMKVMGLMLSNALVGFAGGVLAQYQGNADINMGRGAIVIGLAAIVIGEVIFGRISNFAVRLGGTAFGAIVYYIVIAIVLWLISALKLDERLGIGSSDMKLFTALIVAIFLAIPYLKSKYGAKKKAVKKEV